jgi:hypothetical protein
MRVVRYQEIYLRLAALGKRTDFFGRSIAIKSGSDV